MTNIVINVRNDNVDLTTGRVYKLAPREPLDPPDTHYLRVIDESGEGYLYPTSWFFMVEVPDEVVALIWTPPPKPVDPGYNDKGEHQCDPKKWCDICYDDAK